MTEERGLTDDERVKQFMQDNAVRQGHELSIRFRDHKCMAYAVLVIEHIQERREYLPDHMQYQFLDEVHKWMCTQIK